jgi:hypothetical protein
MEESGTRRAQEREIKPGQTIASDLLADPPLRPLSLSLCLQWTKAVCLQESRDPQSKLLSYLILLSRNNQ